MSASGKVMVLLGDMGQFTGTAKFSQQLIRAICLLMPKSSSTVLFLDEAVTRHQVAWTYMGGI